MAAVKALSFLNSFTNFELQTNPQYYTNFRLDRVVELLKRVGNPQKKIKCIHVAGSKGKGSTCAFTAYILREAGYKVGLYTSPHLNDVSERIRILNPAKLARRNGPFEGKIQTKELAAVVKQIKPAVNKIQKEKQWGGLTYFEILTTIALCHFVKAKVDFAVLETGLGGRLDATNAVESLVCAITPISLEHTQLLGLTIKDITREKAAIIKDCNQTVVIAPQSSAAEKILQQRCQQVGAKAVYVGKDIRYELVKQNNKKQMLNIIGKEKYPNLKMRMLGEHQIVNVAVAVGIVESLRHFGVNVSEDAIRKGINKTFWPGRFEIVRQKPGVILDGAHSAASCQALVQTFQKIFPGEKAILILSILKDKDKKAICAKLNQIAKSVILTKTSHPRTIDWGQENIGEIFVGKKIIKTKNAREAFTLAFQKATVNDIILVAGSLFLVGEVRKLCLKQV